MRLYIVLICFAIPTILFTQSGFIQSYDFQDGGLGFYNILLQEDTLIVFGSAKHPTLPQWGLYFAKLDTMGNILSERTHYDPLGRSYVFEQGYQIIKTEDSGYATVGVVFQQTIPALFKLNADGDLEFVKEYPDNTVFTIHHTNVIETENGFISLGVKQQMDDGYWDAFIMGTDKQGNKQWEINYGEYGVWDRLPGIQKITENEFLLTGSTFISSSQVSNYDNLWAMPKAVKIDTLGQILWEWEGNVAYGSGSIPILSKPYLTIDGNWVNEGGVRTVLAPDEQAFQGEVVKRDTNFNVIWQTSFGQPTSVFNNFIDIAPSPDGGWVAVGQYVNSVEGDPLGGFHAAMIAKVSADGDSLWSRIDTLFDHTIIASRPYLSGIVVLPSGSIFACGKVDKTYPSPSKSYGWLIKVDNDGCMEPGCNPMVNSTNLIPLLEGFEVYPNPVVDICTVHGVGRYDLELINANGQILKQYKDRNELTDIDISEYASGIYFLRIRKGSTWLTKRILKI